MKFLVNPKDAEKNSARCGIQSGKCGIQSGKGCGRQTGKVSLRCGIQTGRA